jgi:outer membrane biosynthesis protein TonB
MVAPAYPRLANLTGVEGKVELSGTVGRDGRIERVIESDGPGLLLTSATEAFQKWEFTKCKDANCVAKGVFVFQFVSSCRLPDCTVEVEVLIPDTIVIKAQRAKAIPN